MPNENIYKPFLKRKKLDIMFNKQYVNPVNKVQLINSATTSIFRGKNILLSLKDALNRPKCSLNIFLVNKIKYILMKRGSVGEGV